MAPSGSPLVPSTNSSIHPALRPTPKSPLSPAASTSSAATLSLLRLLSSPGLPFPPHSHSGHLPAGRLSLPWSLSLSLLVSLPEQSLPTLTCQPVRQPRLPAVSWGIDKDK